MKQTHPPASALTRVICDALRFALIVLLNTGLLRAAVTPLGTDFSYQGRLNAGAGAANGLFDFTFALQDAASGGTPIITVTNSSVRVSEGLFTTTINFGANVFIGYAMWMEIGVRSNGLVIPFMPVVGTIGQPDVGDSGSTAFGLMGGFWGFLSVLQTPGVPQLAIRRNPNQATVTVFWSAPAVGWVLDHAGAIEARAIGSSWSQVGFPYHTNGSQISISIPSAAGTRFYRLRKP